MNKEFLKKKIAFLFPGIGSDYRGLVENFDKSQIELLESLSKRVYKKFGIDLLSYLLDKKDSCIHNTLTIWASIYTCDYIIYNSYFKMDIEPNYLMGYSMGLITALACSQSITYENGIEILQEILNYHKVEEEEGMSSIIGLTFDEINTIIKESDSENKVFIACENNEYCFVISGLKKNVELVSKLAMEQNALKIYDIKTNFAFHTQFLIKGNESLKKLIKNMKVKDSKIPVVSSINQKIIYKSEELKKELINNMHSKMLWINSISNISKNEPISFLEVSLDKSLTKVSRMINLKNKFYTYNSIMK